MQAWSKIKVRKRYVVVGLAPALVLEADGEVDDGAEEAAPSEVEDLHFHLPVLRVRLVSTPRARLRVVSSTDTPCQFYPGL